jgi:hypothetical protein
LNIETVLFSFALQKTDKSTREKTTYHVVPVGDNAVLDRVFERQDAALGLRLVADVRVLLAHADHDALVTRATARMSGAKEFLKTESKSETRLEWKRLYRARAEISEEKTVVARGQRSAQW